MKPEISPIPFDEFRRRILALYEPPLRSPASFGKMRYMLGQLEALGIETTAQLTTDTVARFVASRPSRQSTHTTHGWLAVLRVACNIAAAEGWVDCSPFAVRKNWIRRTRPKGKRHHSREEIARVLALAARDVRRKTGFARWRAYRLYALIATVAYTGIRKREALFLRSEDIDFPTGMIRLIPRVGNQLKTDAAAQPVPMPPPLVQILRGWLAELARPMVAPEPQPPGKRDPRCKPELATGRPVDLAWVFPNAWRTGPWVGGSRDYRPLDRFKMLGKRAGVAGFTFQSLRHSFATHCEGWGLSPAMIQRLLRHTTTRTQDHYRHADLENMRAWVARIGFGSEIAEAEASATALPYQSVACDPALLPDRSAVVGPSADVATAAASSKGDLADFQFSTIAGEGTP